MALRRGAVVASTPLSHSQLSRETSPPASEKRSHQRRYWPICVANLVLTALWRYTIRGFRDSTTGSAVSGYLLRRASYKQLTSEAFSPPTSVTTASHRPGTDESATRSQALPPLRVKLTRPSQPAHFTLPARELVVCNSAPHLESSGKLHESRSTFEVRGAVGF